MFGGVSWLASSKGSENKTVSTPVSSLLYYRRPSPLVLSSVWTHTSTRFLFFFFLTHTQENAGYSRFLTSRRRHIVWWNSFSSGWNRLSYQFFLFLWLFIDGEANIFVVCWQFDSFPAHVFLDISGLFFSLYTRDEWPLDSRYRTTSITSIRVWKK